MQACEMIADFVHRHKAFLPIPIQHPSLQQISCVYLPSPFRPKNKKGKWDCLQRHYYDMDRQGRQKPKKHPDLETTQDTPHWRNHRHQHHQYHHHRHTPTEHQCKEVECKFSQDDHPQDNRHPSTATSTQSNDQLINIQGIMAHLPNVSSSSADNPLTSQKDNMHTMQTNH